jgi:hypothetical protein
VLQGPVKRLALASALRTELAVQWGVHLPSFALYRGEAAPRRPPEPGEVAVVRLDRFAPSPGYRLLQVDQGYGLVRRRLVPVAEPPGAAGAGVGAE